jgi:hypothetical protein
MKQHPVASTFDRTIDLFQQNVLFFFLESLVVAALKIIIHKKDSRLHEKNSKPANHESCYSNLNKDRP